MKSTAVPLMGRELWRRDADKLGSETILNKGVTYSRRRVCAETAIKACESEKARYWICGFFLYARMIFAPSRCQGTCVYSKTHFRLDARQYYQMELS